MNSEIENFYKSHNLWLICGINHNGPWPNSDLLTTYNNKTFLLRGLIQEKIGRTQASILLPLINERKEHIETELANLYSFCSALTWFEGQYVDIVRYVIATQPIFCGGDVRGYVTAGTSNYNLLPNNLKKHESLALTFWKHALGCNDIFYSFLTFYKVIESQFKNNSEKVDLIKGWIGLSIPELKGIAEQRITEINQLSKKTIKNYIYESCRCAIAHASIGDTKIANPDNPRDRERISRDLILIKSLAEKYINDVLGIKNRFNSIKIDVNRYSKINF